MHSHTQSPWPAANSRRSRSPGAGRWCLSPRMYSPPRQPPIAFESCGVFRPHAGKLGLVGFSHVGMAGLEPAASRPPAARCQLRHIPKPSPSSPGAEAPMGQKGGWRRRTPAGTRTRINGFGDRRACHCTTDAKGGVHRAMRAAARPSGRKTRSTPPESPEPDSNRRPAAYEAAALPLGHRGLDGPSHRFFQCMMRVCPHGCLVRRATGGTVWWSRRDSDPRPSRCERDALPLRHGPMPALPYAGRAGWKRSHSGGGITPLVPPAGFEPATPTLGGWRSIP